MASDTDDTAVTKFTEENAEQTGLRPVEFNLKDILKNDIFKRYLET